MSKPDNNIGLGAILDKYAEYYFDQIEGFGSMHTLNKEEAIRQIEDFYRNKIPEKSKDLYLCLPFEAYEEPPHLTNGVCEKHPIADGHSVYSGYNKCVDDITAQFNSKGDNDG